MPTTPTQADRQNALAIAVDRDTGSPTYDVVKEAEKILAFLTGGSVSTPVVAAAPTVTAPSVFRNEYRNRHTSGTHWGKAYKTLDGARKNRRNPQYVRTVEYKAASQTA